MPVATFMNSIVLLRDDGSAAREGPFGELSVIPAPSDDNGTAYTQVAVGNRHISLLRGDGGVDVFLTDSDEDAGAPLSPKMAHSWKSAAFSYTQIAAGSFFTIMLTSKGTFSLDFLGKTGWAPKFEKYIAQQFSIRAPNTEAVFTEVAAGYESMAWLCKNGLVFALMTEWAGNFGNDHLRYEQVPWRVRWIRTFQSDLYDVKHIDIAYHLVLQTSAGSCVAFANGNPANDYGQSVIPEPPAGLTYTQVSAGLTHTAVLLSNGHALAYGDNEEGQCEIPALPCGLLYEHVFAGFNSTILRRCDGSVVVCAGEEQIVLPFRGHLKRRRSCDDLSSPHLRSSGNGAHQTLNDDPRNGPVMQQADCAHKRESPFETPRCNRSLFQMTYYR